MSTRIKGRYSNILVGIDGSELLIYAADYAINVNRNIFKMFHIHTQLHLLMLLSLMY
jgi:nucleotide-binding universal stress UspA family protein